nr:hypothetical protein [Tanacetum cinerariifolium]
TTDVVRLQALIDRRKVIITEDTIQQALRLDDADSIDCLPNEEIFAELARMGNVDSSSKFYMYPRFLQLMSNAQIDDLSSHNTKYTSPALTKKVFANIRRVGGCIQTRGKIAKLDADEDVTLEEVDAEKDVEETDEAEPVEESALRRRRGVIIQDPEEAATASLSVQSETKKNMMVYFKNMAGFKMDLFKAKKQRINEEVEELKTHLQIVPNDEEDVYTKATPLALKVPIVDYQIHTKNNKPYYKIIRADGTHQLFLSFISLLRKFDREDLEMLWKIFQERFASSEPKDFSNDFLLNALKTMFEKPNVESNI